MTHDEAKTLTFPATCWHKVCDENEVWMPGTVTLFFYGKIPGAGVFSFIGRTTGDGRTYSTGVEHIHLTREEVEDVIAEGLTGSYQSCIDAIRDAEVSMNKIKNQPLWRGPK